MAIDGQPNGLYDVENIIGLYVNTPQIVSFLGFNIHNSYLHTFINYVYLSPSNYSLFYHILNIGHRWDFTYKNKIYV